MASARRSSVPILLSLGITALVLAAMAVIDLAAAAGEEGRAAFVRHTARSSLALFLLTYAAGPAARLWPGAATRWLRRHRRWFGLSLALSHFTHLAGIFLLHGLQLFERRSPLSLIIGGVPYLFLGLMALTSSDRAMAWLGRRWRLLHWTGMQLLWIGFLLPYVGRLSRSAVYAVPVALLVAALALRGIAFMVRR